MPIRVGLCTRTLTELSKSTPFGRRRPIFAYSEGRQRSTGTSTLAWLGGKLEPPPSRMFREPAPPDLGSR